MQKLFFKNTLFFLAAAAVWVSCGFYLMQHSPIKGGLNEEGYGINPSSRKYFEFMRNHDPETGEIPDNWKQLQQEFANRMPKRGDRDLTWEHRGPHNIGGRTRALAIDVLNDNHIIAGGVTSGVWSSNNGGSSWTHGTEAQHIHSLSCVVQDTRPGHENTWYYGTGEEFYGVVSGTSFTSLFSGDGIFKSTDNGTNWQPLVSTQSGTPQYQLQNGSYDFIWRMAVDISNTAEDEVYAAVYNGIIRSVDGGTTWQNVLGFGNGPSEFTDVLVTPEGVVYATFSDNSNNGGGFYRSEDGVNWVGINPTQPEIANLRRTVMTMNPQNHNEIFFLGETLNNNQYALDHFLYKYTYIGGDGTTGTWENRSANLPDEACNLNTGIDFDFGTFRSQYSYDLTIAHHPTSNVLFIGGINLHRGIDGFSTDTNDWIGGYRCNPQAPWFYVYPNHHPDQHYMVFHPTNPNVLYSTNDGGIYRTDDCMADSITWTSLNNGYIASQFYTVGFEQGVSNSDFIMGGMQDNGTWITNSADPNQPWKEVHADDGAFCAIPEGRDFVISTSQSGRMMKKLIDDQGNLMGSERIDPQTAPSYLFINPILLDPVNHQDVFIAANKAIWYLPNVQDIPVTGNYPTKLADSLWVRLTTSSVPLLAGAISCIDKPINNNNVIYYGTNQGKVYRLDNCYSDTPTRVDISDTQFPANGYVSSISVNDYHPNEILIGFSNYNKKSLFHSTDSGDTWTDVSGNLEENSDGTGAGPGVYGVEIYPSDPPQYFVGTSAGLYSTTSLDSTSTIWQMEGANTIGNVIINQINSRPYDGLLIVGTHGNGIWTTHLQPAVGIGYNAKDWKKDWRVYPTQVSDYLKVESPSGTTGKTTVKLYNLSGQQILEEQFQAEKKLHQINTQQLVSGMYLFVIENNGKKTTGKIVHE